MKKDVKKSDDKRSDHRKDDRKDSKDTKKDDRRRSHSKDHHDDKRRSDRHSSTGSKHEASKKTRTSAGRWQSLSNHSFTYIKYDNIDLFKLLTDFFLELINIFCVKQFCSDIVVWYWIFHWSSELCKNILTKMIICFKTSPSFCRI